MTARLRAALFCGMALAFAPALAGMSQVEKAAHTLLAPRSSELRRIRNGGGFGFGRSTWRRGPGWTCAHVKRMARRHRNALRNRLRQRGGRTR